MQPGQQVTSKCSSGNRDHNQHQQHQQHQQHHPSCQKSGRCMQRPRICSLASPPLSRVPSLQSSCVLLLFRLKHPLRLVARPGLLPLPFSGKGGSRGDMCCGHSIHSMVSNGFVYLKCVTHVTYRRAISGALQGRGGAATRGRGGGSRGGAGPPPQALS